jgi:hypothetical protein
MPFKGKLVIKTTSPEPIIASDWKIIMLLLDFTRQAFYPTASTHSAVVIIDISVGRMVVSENLTAHNHPARLTILEIFRHFSSSITRLCWV